MSRTPPNRSPALGPNPAVPGQPAPLTSFIGGYPYGQQYPTQQALQYPTQQALSSIPITYQPAQVPAQTYSVPAQQYAIQAPQYAVQPQQLAFLQQPQYVPQQVRTVQLPKQTVVNETHEVKMVRPKLSYTSEYVLVPKTVQEPKTIQVPAFRPVTKTVYETKLVPVQVPKTITVQETQMVDKEVQIPKVITVEREIRIPAPVMETRTVKVPRQRVVIDHEEHTFEVEATEEYTHTVTVPRTVTHMEQHVIGNAPYSPEYINSAPAAPIYGGAQIINQPYPAQPPLYGTRT